MEASGPVLLVLRHGKSAWDTGAPTDFERPLAARGRRDAPRMGAWLRDHDLVPERVLSSPAARARETVELVLETLDLPETVAAFDPRLYDADVDDICEVLAESAAPAQRVLLVGHNPGLEELVRFLTGSVPPHEGKFFPTAALAHLRLPAWSPLSGGCAELRDLVRPKHLDAG